MEFHQHFTWIPPMSHFLYISRLHYISLFGLLLLLLNFTQKLLLHLMWFKYDKKGIVLCIVIIVLMVIQNKIILPQFAYREHLHKKPEVLLTLLLLSNQHCWNSSSCTRPAVLSLHLVFRLLQLFASIVVRSSSHQGTFWQTTRWTKAFDRLAQV